MQQTLSLYSPREVARHLDVGAGVALLDQVDVGVAVGNGLDLALLHRDVEQVGRVLAPGDVFLGVDAVLGQQDREEVLAPGSRGPTRRWSCP
jgi:hypothetical protein